MGAAEQPSESAKAAAEHARTNGEEGLSPVQLNPPELDITDRERDFIEELAPLLSDSPRVLKRFANTYRLLRAGLSPKQQAGFADGTVDKFRVCMFQLAVDKPLLF